MQTSTSIIYCRNRLYVNSEEQEQYRKARILLAGAGLGSTIAECLLRTGFEHITVIDGDVVELSNLNRQNYVLTDAGKPKANVLKKRLFSINPMASISGVTVYLDRENMRDYINGHDIAINAIDFTTDAPFLFDRLCAGYNIPVLHPYNLGWAACLCVIVPNGPNMELIQHDPDKFESDFVKYIIDRLNLQGTDTFWLQKLLQQYRKEKGISPPQLGIGSYLLAAICTKTICNIVTGKKVMAFPEFYYLDTN